jgi:hypothetical protein
MTEIGDQAAHVTDAGSPIHNRCLQIRLYRHKALKADAIPAASASDTVWGSLLGSPADKMTVSPTSDAVPNREVASRSTAMETTLVTPAGTTRAKRVRVGWRRQEVTGRRWAALWRPDASAGPNPGGGFYGAPNINVGHIDPRSSGPASVVTQAMLAAACDPYFTSSTAPRLTKTGVGRDPHHYTSPDYTRRSRPQSTPTIVAMIIGWVSPRPLIKVQPFLGQPVLLRHTGQGEPKG